jgi:dTDP-4-amino-4,6-dideoxygalactose transaminase
MVGCDGDAAVFSLEYTKVLSGGRGGFVLFQSEELRRKTMETVRNDPGSKPLRAVCSIFKDVLLYRGVTLPFVYPLFIKWFHRRRGYSGDTGILRPIRDSLYTAGLSGPEAFMALGNLDRVEEIIRKREEIATRYIRELSGLAMVRTPRPEPTDRVSWMRFPLRITGMDKKIFYERMLARGVDLGFSFSYSLSPDRERSRRTAAETVNLPCYSTLSPAEVDRVVSAVKAALDPEGVA